MLTYTLTSDDGGKNCPNVWQQRERPGEHCRYRHAWDHPTSDTISQGHLEDRATSRTRGYVRDPGDDQACQGAHQREGQPACFRGGSARQEITAEERAGVNTIMPTRRKKKSRPWMMSLAACFRQMINEYGFGLSSARLRESVVRLA